MDPRSSGSDSDEGNQDETQSSWMLGGWFSSFWDKDPSKSAKKRRTHSDPDQGDTKKRQRMVEEGTPRTTQPPSNVDSSAGPDQQAAVRDPTRNTAEEAGPAPTSISQNGGQPTPYPTQPEPQTYTSAQKKHTGTPAGMHTDWPAGAQPVIGGGGQDDDQWREMLLRGSRGTRTTAVGDTWDPFTRNTHMHTGLSRTNPEVVDMGLHQKFRTGPGGGHYMSPVGLVPGPGPEKAPSPVGRGALLPTAKDPRHEGKGEGAPPGVPARPIRPLTARPAAGAGTGSSGPIGPGPKDWSTDPKDGLPSAGADSQPDLGTIWNGNGEDNGASQPWGNLLSLNANHPHVTLSGQYFTIGRHWRCNLQLLDPNISRLFCRLIYLNGTVVVESLSKNGKLFINNKAVQPNTKQPINPGDEITIMASSRFSYIFEITESAMVQPKKPAAAAADQPSVPAPQTQPGDGAAVNVPAKTEAPKVETKTETTEFDRTKLEKNMYGKAALKRLTKLVMAKYQTHVVQHKDINIDFDDFPYHINDEFKQRLVNNVYVYLKHPDYVKHTKQLSTMNRGIMLTGPPGTELYQLAVVKALAKHMEANLLVFSSDSLTATKASLAQLREMEGKSESLLLPSKPDAPSTPQMASQQKPRGNPSTPAPATDPHMMQIDNQGDKSPAGEDLMHLMDSPDIRSLNGDQQQPPKISLPQEEGDNTENVNDGPEVETFLPPIHADDMGGLTDPEEGGVPGASPPNLSDEDEDGGDDRDADQPDVLWELVCKSMSKELRLWRKDYIFQKGDTVRYVGPLQNADAGLLGSSRGAFGDGPGGLFSSMYNSLSGGSSSSRNSKNPPPNAEGTVVMTFGGNTKRVGVRFNQKCPGSISIGSHTNCFFVSADDLRVVGVTHQTPDEAVISALVQTCVKNAPCILFVRDTDRALFANNDRFMQFKLELSRLTKPVVVIGSSIVAQSSAGAVAAPAKAPTGKRERQLPQLLFMEGRNLFSAGASKPPARKAQLAQLLPIKLPIRPPTESQLLETWKEQVKEDLMHTTLDANMRHLRSALAKSHIALQREDELGNSDEASILQEEVLSAKHTDLVIGYAISHHLKTLGPNASVQWAKNEEMEKSDEEDNEEKTAERGERHEEGKEGEEKEGEDVGTPGSKGKRKAEDGMDGEKKKVQKRDMKVKKKMDMLELPLESLLAALRWYAGLRESKKEKRNIIQDVVTDNDYEKSLISNVIFADQIGVTFDDIGALTKVKNTLFELVILPLRRPELFTRGNLTKPLKGILLFGPPGTGKTLLAKAVAAQSGANFLNISVSSITSKWVGEGEKYAKAVFTLASKITPCVIFIDEIDSMLGRRDSQYEHEGMRKIKNEFMSMWDGLTTKADERVIVLAATNRPFDLDDAVLRRLPRRLLVDLPDLEQREQILSLLLRSERLEPDFDFLETARLLEGYSGSDIRNLCVAAAYHPIREIIAREGLVEKLQAEGKAPAGTLAPPVVSSALDSPRFDASAATVKVRKNKVEPPYIRELRMKDFEEAKKEVSASCSESAQATEQLRKWNETYGESQNQWKSTLTYFT